MLQVTFHPVGEINESQLQFAVIAAHYHDQWILCRHRDRDTWEIPGGHHETGETIEETALRELMEETGAIAQEIFRVSDYGVTKTNNAGFKTITYGALFYAEVQQLGTLDPHSEIAEIHLFDCLPEHHHLTYPMIQPELHIKIQVWRNLQSNADEIWDVYNEKRQLTNRTHRRGDPMKRGDYHLVVHVWLQNPDGTFLITRRAPNKGFPNMWECTGGSALAGDDSLTAAVREVREETGLVVDPTLGRLVYQFQRPDNFTDVWLFPIHASLQDVILQEGETTEAKFASKEEILNMYHDGTLIPFYYMDQFSEYIR